MEFPVIAESPSIKVNGKKYIDLSDERCDLSVLRMEKWSNQKSFSLRDASGDMYYGFKLTNNRRVDVFIELSFFKVGKTDRYMPRPTFEIFRRNNRTLDIITYDELYERASFIVNGEVKDGEVN